MHRLCGQTTLHFLPCIVFNQHSVLGFNTMFFYISTAVFSLLQPHNVGLYSASHHDINNSPSSHKNNGTIAKLISTFQSFDSCNASKKKQKQKKQILPCRIAKQENVKGLVILKWISVFHSCIFAYLEK